MSPVQERPQDTVGDHGLSLPASGARRQHVLDLLSQKSLKRGRTSSVRDPRQQQGLGTSPQGPAQGRRWSHTFPRMSTGRRPERPAPGPGHCPSSPAALGCAGAALTPCELRERDAPEGGQQHSLLSSSFPQPESYRSFQEAFQNSRPQTKS